MDSTDTGCSDSYNSIKSRSGGSSLNYSSDANDDATIELTDRTNNRSAMHAATIITSADPGTTTTITDIGTTTIATNATIGGTTTNAKGLRNLPRWPPVNLEFRDLTYTVSDVERGNKQILRGINGEFRSHELTAIMGPSGAGKTTLLNLLAGYGATRTSGEIYINHNPRNMRVFRKMSRYIMQNDVLDPHFTVAEAMMFAASLKLGNELTRIQKLEIIDDILAMLRLKGAENTKAKRLSGGEKKRLCVALELVNSPPVVFLDEPTTGLDDLSSSQCIALLRRIAHDGRTIICSIHTPSAKLFNMFDKVYVLSEGQCAYQGSGANIVPYMRSIGLTCPLTYNPADFIIEVACREYGDHFQDLMVDAIDNGRCYRWTPDGDRSRLKNESPTKTDSTSGASSYEEHEELQQFEEEINPKLLRSKSSWWLQYRLLLVRMFLQMWRQKSYIKLKLYMNIILALLIGGLYLGVGNDATKALFNFGFAFTIVIAYLYLPMMPVLLQFPAEIRLLKREYFNQWYRLSSYYSALLCSKLPFMFFLATIYLSIIYLMSSQPLEWKRFLMLFIIAFLTAMTSVSFGLLVSSRLSLVNAMFTGPVVAVPLILLSCYGIGFGRETYISPLMRFIMSLSYLRHGMEGLVASLYGFNRADTICPDTELFCMFKKSQYLLETLGFDNLNYPFSVSCLIGFYILFTIAAFVLLRDRLTLRDSSNVIVQYANQFLRKHFNFASYKY